MRIRKTDTSFLWNPSTVMVLISCACLFVQLAATPFRRTAIISLANQVLLWSWLLFGGYLIVRKMMKTLPIQFIYCVLLVVMSFSSCLVGMFQKSGSATELLTMWIRFVTLPIMFMYYALYDMPERAKKIVLYTNFALSLLFIFLFNSNKAYLYPTEYDYDYQLNAATLGYPNPNRTAMYLFVCASNLLITIFYVKRKFIKWILAVDLVYIIYILYKTESRTAVLVISIVFFAAVITLFKQLPKIWIKVVLLMPLLYVLFAQFWTGLFDGVTFLGEEILTGREELYAQYFSNLNLFNFLLGDFARFQYSNLHNGYISLAATSGIFALVSFIMMLDSELTRNYRYSVFKKHEKVAFVAFLGIILYSCTEAAMFVSGASYATLILTVYLMFSRPYKVTEETSEVSAQ